MTKTEMIERYGIEWYEDYKVKARENYRKRYHENPEKARERRRAEYRRNSETAKSYIKEHREIYRINSRDRNRLVTQGYPLEGKEIHHLKYHRNASDKNWMDDIIILPRDEHRKWHYEHPDFKAEENIV